MASVVSVDEFERLSRELLTLKTQLYETKEREQSAVHKQQIAEQEVVSLRTAATKAKSGLKGIFGNKQQEQVVVEDLRPQVEELKLQNESLKASCTQMLTERQQLQAQVAQFKEQLGVESTASEKSAEEEKNALTAARLADLEDQVGAFRKMEGEKEQEISNMMQQCLKKDERIGKLTTDIEMLEAKVKEKDLAAKEQDSRIKKLASDAAKPAKVSAIQDQMKKVTEGLTETNEKLESEKKELEARLASAEQTLVQQQAVVTAAQNTCEEEKKHAHVLTMDLEKLRSAHQQLMETHEQAKETHQNDIKQLKEQLQTAKETWKATEVGLREELTASQKEYDFVKESLAATQTLLVEANEKVKQGVIDTTELKKSQEDLQKKLSETEKAFEESKVNNTIEGKKRNRLVEELRAQLKKEAIRVRELEASAAETKDALAERRRDSAGEPSKEGADEASGGSEIEQEVSAALSVRLEQSQTENYALKQKSKYLEQNIQLLNEDLIGKKAVIQFLSRRIEPGVAGTLITNPEAHKLFQSQPPAIQQELFDKMEIALQEAVSNNLEIKDNLRKMGSEGTRLLGVIDTLDSDKRQIEDELNSVRDMYQELKDEKELNEMARQDAEKLLKHTENQFKAESSMLSNSLAEVNLKLKLVQMERDRLLAQVSQTSEKMVDGTEQAGSALGNEPIESVEPQVESIPETQPSPDGTQASDVTDVAEISESSANADMPVLEQKRELSEVTEVSREAELDPRLNDVLNADLTLPSNKPPPVPEVVQDPETLPEAEEVEIITSTETKPPTIAPLALSTRRNSEPIEKESEEESVTREAPAEDVHLAVEDPVECVPTIESEPESPIALSNLTMDAAGPMLSSPLAEVSLSSNAGTKFSEELVTPRESESIQPTPSEEVPTGGVESVAEVHSEVASESAAVEPVVSEQPVASERVEQLVSEQAVASEQPVANEQSSEQAVASEQSVASEQPVASEQAVVSEQVASEQTVASEQPVASEQVASEQVASEQVASEQVVSEQVVSEQPLATEQQVASEQVASEQVASEQVGSEQPVASEQVASEPVVEQPTASGQPVAGEPASEAVAEQAASETSEQGADREKASVTVDEQANVVTEEPVQQAGESVQEKVKIQSEEVSAAQEEGAQAAELPVPNQEETKQESEKISAQAKADDNQLLATANEHDELPTIPSEEEAGESQDGQAAVIHVPENQE